MATSEKEINNYLFDQLDILEEVLDLAKKGSIEDIIDYTEKKIRKVERKLYQNPPLKSE